MRERPAFGPGHEEGYHAVPAPLVTEYRYDLDGNVDTLVYPSGLVLKYARDAATGRITSVTNEATGASYASAIRYLPGGPMRSMSLGNGLALSASYNLRYEPRSISSGPVSLGYSTTPAGDISAIDSTDALETFGYDHADRLIRRTVTPGASPEALRFTYDGGRILQALESATGTPRYAYGYDEQSNLSAISQYTEAGTVDRTVCFVHDALGRLVLAGYPSAAGPGTPPCQRESDVAQVLARFRYDARNRRIAREDGSGARIHFVFDLGGNLLSEVASDEEGASVRREYAWVDGLPLAQLEYPGPSAGVPYSYFLHVNHLATPRAMTNALGQLVWAGAMGPYGDVQEATTPDAMSGRTVVTNLRLPGQYDERLLGSVGLQGPYYNWNRWYLPGAGRYLELDPIALAGGFNTEYGVDWYGYGLQNPLKYWDPWGLVPCTLGDTTYTCCLKKYPGCPECCGGSAPPPPRPPAKPPEPPKPPSTCEMQPPKQPVQPEPVRPGPLDEPGITAGLCAGQCAKYHWSLYPACMAICLGGGLISGGL